MMPTRLFSRVCGARWRPALLAFPLALGIPLGAPAVTFTIVNNDGAGEGLNDPVLGAQRLAALQYSADVWGRRLQGTQNVVVQANFDPLGGTGVSATLGFASPQFIWRDFAGAPLAATFYPDGLANQLFGADLNAGADILCTFNSDVDGPVVLGATSFYYGKDESPTGGDMSFCRVAFHEFGHGLGFFDNVDSATGSWSSGFPTVYSTFLREGAGAAGDFTGYADPQRLSAIISDNINTFAPLTIAAHGALAPIYAPNPYEPGSSISHFRQGSFAPAELMEPFLTNNLLKFGLTDEMMEDMGWGRLGPAGSMPTLDAPLPSQFNEASGVQTITFTLSASSTVAVDANLAVGGTATQGVDYTLSTTSLHFNPGTTTQNVLVTPIPDGATEGSETITLSFNGVLGAEFGQNASLQLLDPPTVMWARSTWTNQADVNADPVVGPAGCAALATTPTFGVDAFNSVAGAVSAVPAGGEVRLLDSTFTEDSIAVSKAMDIYAWDFLNCAAPQAVIEANSTQLAAGTIFDVTVDAVNIHDLTLDGDDGGTASLPDLAYGIRNVDMSGGATANGLQVSHVTMNNFALGGILAACSGGSTGFLFDGNQVSNIGDVLSAGSPNAVGIALYGGSGSIQNNTVSFVGGFGIDAAAGDVPGFPPLSGSALQSSVSITGNVLSHIGDATGGDRAGIMLGRRAYGSIDSNMMADLPNGVRVPSNPVSRTIDVLNNTITGTMETAVQVSAVRGDTGSPNAAVVNVQGNLISGTINTEGIGFRQVGDASNNRLGQATLALNTVTVSEGGFGHDFAHIYAIDPVAGSFFSIENVCQASVGLPPLTAMRITNLDGGSFLPSGNVSVGGDSFTGFARGLVVESIDNLPLVPVDVTVPSHIPSTTISLSVGDGIEVTGQAGSLDCDGAYVHDSGANNLRVHGGATANVRSSRVEDAPYGILVEDAGSHLDASSNQIGRSTAFMPMVGVAFETGTTGMLGDATLVGTGQNTFELQSGDTAIRNLSGAVLQAENNNFAWNAALMNGPTAIDDFLYDGDVDNSYNPAEFDGTRIDFIPFLAGLSPASVTVDQAASVDAPASYGITTFRTLSDGIAAVVSTGTVNVVSGDYHNGYYAADSQYNRDTLHVTRAMTIVGPATQDAFIYPFVDNPGPTGTADGARRAVTDGTNIFSIEHDGVSLRRLVLDGDNPGIGGTITSDGADINGRNGVVLDPATAPQNVRISDSSIRNFLFNGVVVPAGSATPVDRLLVDNVTFTNIGLLSASAPASGVQLNNVTSSRVSNSRFNRCQNGINLAANDASTTHTVSANQVTSSTLVAIAASDFQAGGNVQVTGNQLHLDPGTIGVDLHDVTAGGTSTVGGNTVLGGGVQALLRRHTGASRIDVTGNTLDGGRVGIALYETDNATTAVLLRANAIDSQTTAGISISTVDPVTGVSEATTRGVSVSANTITNCPDGVLVTTGGAGVPAEAEVGGLLNADANLISGCTRAIHVSTLLATARIQNFSPAWVTPPLNGNGTHVLVDSGAQALLEGNSFGAATSAAVSVQDNSQVLMERNYLRPTAAVGVLTGGTAVCEMGPGSPLNQVTAPYFAGATSVGENVFRNFALGSETAIRNLSAHDQNAQNCDFTTLVLADIESMVFHQPDDPSSGVVLYNPPRLPFTSIDDAFTLEH